VPFVAAAGDRCSELIVDRARCEILFQNTGEISAPASCRKKYSDNKQIVKRE